MKKYFPHVRTLHLYIGLFLSPLIIIFGISVLVMNHTNFMNRSLPVVDLKDRTIHLETLPNDTSDLITAKLIMKKLRINGEIDWIRRDSHQISFPVRLPGLKTMVKVDRLTNDVLISQKNEGSLRATSYLHAMPGPHNVKVRGNSNFMKAWALIADSVVYLLMFLTASGIFLWYFLKGERYMGVYAIILGILSFTILMFLIFK